MADPGDSDTEIFLGYPNPQHSPRSIPTFITKFYFTVPQGQYHPQRPCQNLCGYRNVIQQNLQGCPSAPPPVLTLTGA